MYGFKWPSKPEEREENFYVIGTDGLVLLNAVYQDLDREWLRHIPAVDVLRKVWIQQYHVHGDQVRLREPKDTPPGACADSDTTNIAGNPYDTEMWSNSFDLTGVTAASLDLNYRHRQLGISVFDIDISTDGGATWTNEFSDTAGNPSGTAGDPLSLDLAAYIGNPNVIARFRYYGDSWDWYAQVDDVSLSCHVPSIDFEKTVGTDPNFCATENNIIVASGTDVTYCYEVTNTGNVTLTQHNVVDTELGTLLNNFPFVLTPGNSTFVTLTVISNQTTVNTGTWTAYNPGPTDVASDTDSATVAVEAPIIEVQPLSLAATQKTDLQTTHPLTITNSGNIALNWNIVEDDTACDSPADVPWLTVNPTAGTTPPAATDIVDITFDSTGLNAGVYLGSLCVSSNDPDPGPGNGTDLVIVDLEMIVEVFKIGLLTILSLLRNSKCNVTREKLGARDRVSELFSSLGTFEFPPKPQSNSDS